MAWAFSTEVELGLYLGPFCPGIAAESCGNVVGVDEHDPDVKLARFGLSALCHHPQGRIGSSVNATRGTAFGSDGTEL
jgi:hypothetical protein